MKNKNLPFELLTRSQKIKVTLQTANLKSKNLVQVPNSIVKLFLFHFWVTNLTLKNKKLPFELLTRIDKYLISLEAINSMVKLLVFHFWVTNSSLKNKKFHFELLTGWVHFYFSLSSYEFEVVKWEKILKYYSFKMIWTKSF